MKRWIKKPCYVDINLTLGGLDKVEENRSSKKWKKYVPNIVLQKEEICNRPVPVIGVTLKEHLMPARSRHFHTSRLRWASVVLVLVCERERGREDLNLGRVECGMQSGGYEDGGPWLRRRAGEASMAGSVSLGCWCTANP
jgi:hypothetical protein